MSRLAIGDRIASAVVGAVVGAIVGLALAWLLGVYSNTLGPSSLEFGLAKFVAKVSVTFALLGLVLGPSVGTLLGNVIRAVFAFENPEVPQLPAWLIVALLIVFAAGVWWFLGR